MLNGPRDDLAPVAHTRKGKAMSIMKWHVSRWNQNIEKVEVLFETKCFATIKDSICSGRIKKEGTIFDTFEDAQDFLVARASGKASHYQRELCRAQSELKECKNLTPPKE